MNGPWLEEPYDLRARERAGARTDEDILRAVRKSLARSSGLDLRGVDCWVEDCEVLLEGTVPERWMQLEIEHACLHVPNVRSVVSHLETRPDE